MVRERRCRERKRRSGSLKRRGEKSRRPKRLIWTAGVVEIDAQVPVSFLGRQEVLVGKSAHGGLGNEHVMKRAMGAVMSDNMAFWFVVMVRMRIGMRVNMSTRVR